jgi:hypothetical protein
LSSFLTPIQSELEHSALSGELFNPIEPSSSPARTPSPSNDPEELVSFAFDEHVPHGHTQHSIGLGDGRTGVKGVIRDRNEVECLERERKLKEAEERKRKMQQHERGLKSFLEEERENAGHAIRQDDLPRKNAFGHGRTGYLREIGVENFVRAVEQAEKGAFVIIHLYDPVSSVVPTLLLVMIIYERSLWTGVQHWMKRFLA